MTDNDAERAIERIAAWASGAPDVAAAWLFGSRARGDGGPGSDIDVAVLPRPGAGVDPLRRRLRWMVEAADAAGLGEEELDLVDLSEAPVLLAHAALRDGRLLASPDPVARTAFVESTIHRSQEALHLHRIAEEVRRRRFGRAEAP
ncbi:MAG: nucleotidyltransferase domain-containing protein [Myxococcales bacterium]|nr:nucleotidyltransferase domain-containing protein [Myxococcales bacterium]